MVVIIQNVGNARLFLDIDSEHPPFHLHTVLSSFVCVLSNFHAHTASVGSGMSPPACLREGNEYMPAWALY